MILLLVVVVVIVVKVMIVVVVVVAVIVVVTLMIVAATVNDSGSGGGGDGISGVQLQTQWLQFANKPSVWLSVGSRATQTGYCRAAPLYTSHPMQKLIYTKTRRGLGTAGALESKCRSLMNRFKKSVRQYNLHSPWMARPII